MTHDLKTWPEPFQAILDGTKTYEIRTTGDRTFAVGDVLRLREWLPFGDQRYTGRETTRVVSYITPPGRWGLPSDLCVMALASPAPVEPREACDCAAHGLEEHVCATAARRDVRTSPSPVTSGGTAAYDWMSGDPCPHGLKGEEAAWCLDCESEAAKANRPGGTGKRGTT
jgi:hypothetical protein